MKSSSNVVTLATAIARVTLVERVRRRKLISGLLLVFITIFGIGVWPLSEWLSESFWGMLVWLLSCVFLALFLGMLALYDALSVIKEERAKLGVNKPDVNDP
ncbi:hypothetical protein N9A89_00710 [Akkermansiaceae bacterium]|nr:hypothetical protein [Akkermansiaceae bacterium]MDA7936091.1 hypothetical protein [bacterium]MDA7672386.1 hypothetical protein [Akkermansiaceae bacterium]MDA7876568.1 hypothetical protein [Akkermansiaceae bacterium]MDA7935294.1 hypothetical protein [Akkermansiaceae bacterium]